MPVTAFDQSSRHCAEIKFFAMPKTGGDPRAMAHFARFDRENRLSRPQGADRSFQSGLGVRNLTRFSRGDSRHHRLDAEDVERSP
jgi:hypothetical protein